MNSNAFKVISFNILVVAGLTVGFLYHIIQPIFLNDASYVSYVLGAMMVMASVFMTYDSLFPTDWIRNFVRFEEANFYRIALIGTLIGLGTIITVISAAVANMANPDLPAILAAFASGMRTAFNPTLVGIFSWVWVAHLLYFTRKK